ncbi:MAG: hypothetical protein IJ326_09265 [Lachnospiraceae bacterium]|nr:hypothetical protein [Lachnospiraceae bacterium]
MKKRVLAKWLAVVGMALLFGGSDMTSAVALAAEETAPTEIFGNLEEIEISEEEIDAYFENSVFLGDSIMLGFRNYTRKQASDSFLKQIQFLAAGSYSASNSLWEVTTESVHPLYQGKKLQAWNSIEKIAPDKVFICLGLNDLNISGLQGSLDNYKELIRRIQEKSPEVEIHIISMTYTLAGASSGKLNNDTIREYNLMLLDAAIENGWGYIDVANALADDNGDLAEAYCSDGFVHQTAAAYDVWTVVLREYARADLRVETAFADALEAMEMATAKEVIAQQAVPFRNSVVEAVFKGSI